MSKINLEKQQEQIDRMREELARLNQTFDEVKTACGIVDEKDIQEIDLANEPAELTNAVKVAQDKAAQAGREAVAQLNMNTDNAAPVTAPRRARRGAISA